MLPVLPFLIGGVVGLVAGVIAKTIMDSSDDFHSSHLIFLAQSPLVGYHLQTQSNQAF